MRYFTLGNHWNQISRTSQKPISCRRRFSSACADFPAFLLHTTLTSNMLFSGKILRNSPCCRRRFFCYRDIPSWYSHTIHTSQIVCVFDANVVPVHSSCMLDELCVLLLKKCERRARYWMVDVYMRVCVCFTGVATPAHIIYPYVYIGSQSCTCADNFCVVVMSHRGCARALLEALLRRSKSTCAKSCESFVYEVFTILCGTRRLIE